MMSGTMPTFRGRGGYNNNTTFGGAGGFSNNNFGGGSFNSGPRRGGFGNNGPRRGGYNNSYNSDFQDNLGAVLKSTDFTPMADIPEASKTSYTPSHTRTPEEIGAWMEEHTITVYGERVPPPLFAFDEVVAPEPIHLAFKAAGYATPSSIQAAAWPILSTGRDFVGVAKTGSGKTLGFMVPAILHILSQPPLQQGDGPMVLVLAPTRELAVQIEEESKKVLKHLPHLRTTCLYGGVPKYTQARALRWGVHVCIATPGRLNDMLDQRSTNLLRVSFLVLDEADRMLDMGFEPQIRKICGQIRPERQTVMFSATWPQEIRALAASFQKDFVRVHVGSEKLLANSDVKQHFAILHESEKDDKLIEIFNLIGQKRMIIFTKTKKTADVLHANICRYGIPALVIHGDKEQNHRDRTIERFKRDPCGCLVATDVAARGLDIKELEFVINYDFPTNIEDYVHRIGRTGRAGNKGDAYTFLSMDMNSKTVRDIIDLLKRSNQQVAPELFNLANSNGGRYRYDNRGNALTVLSTPPGMFIGGDDGTPFSASASAVASPVGAAVAALPTTAPAAETQPAAYVQQQQSSATSAPMQPLGSKRARSASPANKCRRMQFNDSDSD